LILQLALEAIDSADACQVLGDAVQEAGWYDPRVIEVMFPQTRIPDGYNAEDRKRARARRDAHRAAFPDLHGMFPGTPTRGWARAVAAVLLFEGFQKRRWPGGGRTPIRFSDDPDIFNFDRDPSIRLNGYVGGGSDSRSPDMTVTSSGGRGGAWHR
jgi:hypothetical protein